MNILLWCDFTVPEDHSIGFVLGVYIHNVVVIVAIYGAAQIHTCLLSVLSKTDYDTLLLLDLTLDNLKFIVSSSSAFSKVKS
jgi:hypothetical protein